LVVVDNVLWGDLLASLEKTSQNTVMLQDLNAMVPADRSVTMSLLPMGDALTLAVMRR
jgi:predicted O-methyltransferase YrrM|tara:strand:+ start:466 stop:639 length:174 start_codon:yes stop_codon:yes gene_type:complete